MTSMTQTKAAVTGGVDTHGQTHHVAVLDHLGRELGDCEFPTTPCGYRMLLSWARSHGQLERIGVEGTGAYGAALVRHLSAKGVQVVEVDRPDRKARRARGKTDPLDAYAAARAALAGTATATPKTRDSQIEAIRTLRVARGSAVKARTRAINQLKALVLTGPAELREQLRHLSTATLVATCGQLLTTAGDNPDRLRSEAAFAHLCGVAPIPRSSAASSATSSARSTTSYSTSSFGVIQRRC